jgi:hypothetical protein
MPGRAKQQCGANRGASITGSRGAASDAAAAACACPLPWLPAFQLCAENKVDRGLSLPPEMEEEQPLQPPQRRPALRRPAGRSFETPQRRVAGFAGAAAAVNGGEDTQACRHGATRRHLLVAAGSAQIKRRGRQDSIRNGLCNWGTKNEKMRGVAAPRVQATPSAETGADTRSRQRWHGRSCDEGDIGKDQNRAAQPPPVHVGGGVRAAWRVTGRPDRRRWQ